MISSLSPALRPVNGSPIQRAWKRPNYAVPGNDAFQLRFGTENDALAASLYVAVNFQDYSLLPAILNPEAQTKLNDMQIAKKAASKSVAGKSVLEVAETLTSPQVSAKTGAQLTWLGAMANDIRNGQLKRTVAWDEIVDALVYSQGNKESIQSWLTLCQHQPATRALAQGLLTISKDAVTRNATLSHWPNAFDEAFKNYLSLAPTFGQVLQAHVSSSPEGAYSHMVTRGIQKQVAADIRDENDITITSAWFEDDRDGVSPPAPVSDNKPKPKA